MVILPFMNLLIFREIQKYSWKKFQFERTKCWNVFRLSIIDTVVDCWIQLNDSNTYLNHIRSHCWNSWFCRTDAKTFVSLWRAMLTQMSNSQCSILHLMSSAAKNWFLILPVYFYKPTKFKCDCWECSSIEWNPYYICFPYYSLWMRVGLYSMLFWSISRLKCIIFPENVEIT